MRKIKCSMGMLFLLLFCVFAPVQGAENSTEKLLHRIPEVNSKIKIDGIMNEKEWDGAKVLTLNYEVFPGENIAPPVETEAFLIYDSKYLYIGFKAYDPELVFPGMPGLASYEVAKDLGLKVATIVYIDLDFRKDGSSIIERKKKGRDPKEIARKALKLVTDGKLETVDGVDKALKVDMLLVHGDGPNAVDILKEMRAALQDAGVKIEPFPNFL